MKCKSQSPFREITNKVSIIIHIKQNNGEMEYDHLDYTRPMSAWKPHYQRMANGFGPSRDGSGTSKASQNDSEQPGGG